MTRLVLPLILLLASCATGTSDSDAAASGVADADSQRFCEIGQELAAARNAFALSGEPDALEAYMALELELADEALRVVPAEIETQFTALIERERALIPVFESLGYDLSKGTPEDFAAAAASTPIPEGARDDIGAWENANC